MPLQFHRVVEEIELWSANSDGYSFTISFFENFPSPGFVGRTGYLASWSPLYRGRGAIKIMGSPFKSLEEAEAACETMLKHLMSVVGACNRLCWRLMMAARSNRSFRSEAY
jgi:hypothetical protein